MKRNFKKSKFVILPALATLVLTGVASVTGTVAWFTANRTVTARGMKFNAKAGSNLLIAGDDLTKTAKLADSAFSSSLTQTINVSELAPASTVDGKNFFFTESAKADGSIEDGGKYQAILSSSITKYYVDYVFQLKAINTETSSQSLYINKIEISYANATEDAKAQLEKAAKAFRCAFFIESAGNTPENEFTHDTTTVKDGLKFIYEPSKAANQKDNMAVRKNSSDDAGPVLANVEYLSQKTAYASVNNGTYYYKGVARLWLEGEDKSCTNDLFKTASNEWSFDLGFRLGDLNSTKADEEAKTNININVTTTTAQA